MDPTLKQRLVGTAVLVGLAVIFVPMILDGPVDQEVPARTTGVPLELPTPQPVDPTPTPTSQPASQPTTQPSGSAAPVVRPAPEPEPEAAGFVVQLGSFSDRSRAEALAGRVTGLGFDAFVQRVVMENGTMYRVRVGPVPDRDAATELATRIQRASGERAVVVAHP